VSDPLVIVSNGGAAARRVDELARCAHGRRAIALIGDEPPLAYNRVLLSSVLAGETAPEDIELKPMSWWRDSPSQAQGAASLELLPTFSAPHRRGDRIGWLLPVLARLRHANRLGNCPLMGEDRRCPAHDQNDAFDPSPTLHPNSSSKFKQFISSCSLGIVAEIASLARG
jgi:hypothetical protein